MTATRAKARADATAAPGPAGRCKLILRIDGTDYDVRPARPEGFGVVAAFTLRKAGGERHTIAQTIEGPTCDCPDHVYRRKPAGESCRHVRAARASGLL